MYIDKKCAFFVFHIYTVSEKHEQVHRLVFAITFVKF